jgi:hypothetical protein
MRTRESLVADVRTRFIAQRNPRLQILLIVAASGGVAFLASMGLLRAGLTHMGVRYPIAALVGYAAFLALIRIWIAWQRRSLDLPLDGLDVGPARGAGGGSDWFGGGRSGGGGGGGHWDGSSHGVESGIDAGFNVDEAWPLVLAAVFALGGVLALGYVVYAAPVLLAEVALDAALVTTLYRKLRREDTRSWVESAFRGTWLAALTVVAMLTCAGIAIQWFLPEAESIGDVFRPLVG